MSQVSLLELMREQVRGRWQRPLGVALLVGVLICAWEALYEGRPPEDWRFAFPWMILLGALPPMFFVELERREQRDVLLKALPTSSAAIGACKTLVPLMLFLPIVLVAVASAALLGAFPLFSKPMVGLMAWALSLLALQCVASLWSELKPRLLLWPFGKVLHFGVPSVVGSALGVALALHAEASGKSSLLEATVGLFDLRLALVAGALSLACAAGTVFLFVRRDSYV